MEENLQKPIDWEKEEENTLDFDYQKTEENHAIIKVIGVGGGGSNAVRHMYEEGIKDVSFLIINTDRQALEGSPIKNRLQISAKGLGAGAKPEVARDFALECEDQIRAALQDGTEMVFITAGMGGGTGTGAAPIVARIAHELGILTIGIVTIPFEFEGRDKIIMALEGVAAIKEHCDALLVVNNNRLIDIYPDFNFFNAFKKADDTLTIAAKSISDIINIQGYINLDFADVSTTLRDGGVALISTGQASGANRVTEAINLAVQSPLLQDNDISNSKHLLFELCFSESNPVSMAEIAELNNFVKGLNTDIKVIWGAMVDNSLGDDVKMILLASGFEMDEDGTVHGKKKEQKPSTETVVSETLVEKTPVDEKVSEDPEEEKVVETPVEETPAEKVEEKPAVVVEEKTEEKEAKPEQKPEVKPVTPPVPQPATTVQQGIDNISKFYGEEMANEMRLSAAREAYYVLDNEELTNEELVELIEKLPAYNRSVEELGELKKRFRK